MALHAFNGDLRWAHLARKQLASLVTCTPLPARRIFRRRYQRLECAKSSAQSN